MLRIPKIGRIFVWSFFIFTGVVSAEVNRENSILLSLLSSQLTNIDQYQGFDAPGNYSRRSNVGLITKFAAADLVSIRWSSFSLSYNQGISGSYIAYDAGNTTDFQLSSNWASLNLGYQFLLPWYFSIVPEVGYASGRGRISISNIGEIDNDIAFANLSLTAENRDFKSALFRDGLEGISLAVNVELSIPLALFRHVGFFGAMRFAHYFDLTVNHQYTNYEGHQLSGVPEIRWSSYTLNGYLGLVVWY